VQAETSIKTDDISYLFAITSESLARFAARVCSD